jgi:hypothetical protein
MVFSGPYQVDPELLAFVILLGFNGWLVGRTILLAVETLLSLLASYTIFPP